MLNMELRKIQKDHLIPKVHQTARDVANHAQRWGMWDEYDWFDDDADAGEFAWRYVEEKSLKGETLGPMAVIQRSDGLELGFTYEYGYDSLENTSMDGVRIAFLIPTDSRGVRADESADDHKDGWFRSFWHRFEHNPKNIAQWIESLLLPKIEELYEMAVEVCYLNERYYDRCQELSSKFAHIKGIHEVDPVNDDKRILEFIGPETCEANKRDHLVPEISGSVAVDEDEDERSKVTVTVSLPVEKARNLVELLVGWGKELEDAEDQMTEKRGRTPFLNFLAMWR